MRILAVLALLPFLQDPPSPTRSVARALAGSGAQDKDTGEQFYKFKVGTTWTYVGTAEGGKGAGDASLVLTVSAQDGDKTEVASTETKPDGSKKEGKARWWREDGFVVWGEYQGDTLRPTLRAWKCGAQKGDTWEANPDKERPIEAKSTHMGTVEVTVPAGTYKDAVNVRFVMEGGVKVQIDQYWVAGIGFVKMQMTVGGEVKRSIELKEYKPQK